MKTQYMVSGLKPALGQKANKILKAAGTGVDGAFVRATALVSVDVKSNKKNKSVKKLLKQGYQTVNGWTNVTVQEI
jgi:hypothetical protein